MVNAVPVQFLKSLLGRNKSVSKTSTPSFNSKTPNIPSHASGNAKEVTFGKNDHKVFGNAIKETQNSAAKSAAYHHAGSNPNGVVPDERTVAYMKHNQQVVKNTPVGVIIVDATPGRIRDLFSRKPNLNSSKPKIARKADPDARVVTLDSNVDHNNFKSSNNWVKTEAERMAKYHRDTYDAQSAIPHERTAAYMKHNLKVLDKTPVGGKISISRSQSQRNNVYHQVKE